MKTGILTWYNELNHGAILQAYSSQENLKALGCEPHFIKYRRNLKRNIGVANVIKKFFNRLVSGDYFFRNKYSHVREEKRVLFDSFIKENMLESDISEKFDCVMIGSDMVFSLIQGYEPYMYGYGVNTDYLFSYAACSGGTKIELAETLGIKKNIKEALSKFNSIGCRDEETIKYVQYFTDKKKISLNIDPVLLYGFKKEIEIWNSGKWEKHKPYVLIYSYHGDMNTRDEINSIKKYAKANDLDIISCGYYHQWCDENIIASPKEFVEMFFNAHAIVTDTFHGTVFSIIFNKLFVSIIRGNGFKLQYLLEQCGLNNRIALDSKSIYKILNNDIDYEFCNKWLDKQRKESNYFLSNNISLAMKK